MTREELKEEMKQQEGDPQIKHRVRQIQRQQAYRRMMHEVPKATVVVTNPTHVAVALRYDPETMGAPTVVAKGERKIAERIKAIASLHAVPVIEEPPLARALFRSTAVGREVPPAFYRAVAQVLAVLYRRRASPGPIPVGFAGTGAAKGIPAADGPSGTYCPPEVALALAACRGAGAASGDLAGAGGDRPPSPRGTAGGDA